MSYKLIKPYTDIERSDFIVEYNHNKGLKIEETSTALLALEPFEKLVEDEVIDNTEEYEAEQEQKERERINMLSLTAADVERAIYKAKGMDFEDILKLVTYLSKGELDIETGEVINKGIDIDVKAFKIEFKANNFYRGNPYIEQVGALLGFTPEMLDRFFESGEWEELVKVEDVEFPPEEDTPAEEQDSEAVEEGMEDIPSNIEDEVIDEDIIAES